MNLRSRHVPVASKSPVFLPVRHRLSSANEPWISRHVAATGCPMPPAVEADASRDWPVRPAHSTVTTSSNSTITTIIPSKPSAVSSRPVADEMVLKALAGLPAPSDKRVALRVSPAAERSLRAGHPWLFDGSIVEESHRGTPGDLGVVFDRKRRFLAIGLYDPTSPLRVRVLQAGKPTRIDSLFWHQRIATALARRARHRSDKDRRLPLTPR